MNVVSCASGATCAAGELPGCLEKAAAIVQRAPNHFGSIPSIVALKEKPSVFGLDVVWFVDPRRTWLNQTTSSQNPSFSCVLVLQRPCLPFWGRMWGQKMRITLSTRSTLRQHLIAQIVLDLYVVHMGGLLGLHPKPAQIEDNQNIMLFPDSRVSSSFATLWQALL